LGDDERALEQTEVMAVVVLVRVQVHLLRGDDQHDGQLRGRVHFHHHGHDRP
jgi:hypothetical protein